MYVLYFSDKNIFVHQTCPCKHVLQCSCPDGSGITYVLGDMSLFWMKGEKLTGKYIEWGVAKSNDPPGTKGMRAPEV